MFTVIDYDKHCKAVDTVCNELEKHLRKWRRRKVIAKALHLKKAKAIASKEVQELTGLISRARITAIELGFALIESELKWFIDLHH